MDVNKEAKESLLVLDKKKGKVKAVNGMDENGNLKTVPPTKAHEQDFLRIDKHSNPLENFFSNFLRQAKDPTHFEFFKIKTDAVENTAPVIETMAQQKTPSSEEMLKEYRVNPTDYSKAQEQTVTQQQQPTNGYKPIDESRIDWDNLKQFGITRDALVKSKSLDPMLNYQKSPTLLHISATLDSVKVDTDARLAFRETEDGRITLAVHGVRKEPNLEHYYGNKFTEEDKKNLQATGNLGRVMDVKLPKQDKPVPMFLSIDKLTNETIAVRADKIRIPNDIKGVVLTNQQKTDLLQGKAVSLEGMVAKSGKEFSADVQINADKRGIEFRFPSAQRQAERTQVNQNRVADGTMKIPQRIGGVELDEKQQSSLKEGGTIYVQGLKDKKGQAYNAYIKVNDKEQKLDFYKWNPDKAKSKGNEVSPDNNSATQVAVNSEGKTNEATKFQNRPIKSGTSENDSPQLRQQYEEPKRNRGVKM